MTATSIESIASTPFFVKIRLIANPLAGLLPELFTVFACGRLVVSRHGQSRMELYVVYLAIDRQVNDHGRLSFPMDVVLKCSRRDFGPEFTPKNYWMRARTCAMVIRIGD